MTVLRGFRLLESDIRAPGGGKSRISQKIDRRFQELGWQETGFKTSATVDERVVESRTHKVDLYKGRIGLEVEWNNKDPFFDRDLDNFRNLFGLDVLSVGVIITRSDHLQDIFASLGKGKSYGASTTHMSKLLSRLERGGGGRLPDSCLWHHAQPLRGGPMKRQRYRAFHDPLHELLTLAQHGQRFGTILADPPWRFKNRTGKMAPEHKRLMRYRTMKLEEIVELPVPHLALPQSHLYLWVPNALVLEGLEVMKRWGFTYKTNVVWYKVRKDGGPDGRGVGFYFRNVTELVLFGIRGQLRTLSPGRRQTNIIIAQKGGHSRKPDNLYEIIEQCSPGPHLELFARFARPNWYQWGDEIEPGILQRSLLERSDRLVRKS